MRRKFFFVVAVVTNRVTNTARCPDTGRNRTGIMMRKMENQAYSKTPRADASTSRLIQEIALGSYQHVVSFLCKGGVQAS